LDSWEKIGLEPRRGVTVVLAISASFFLAVLGAAEVLLRAGPASLAIAALSAAASGYIVSTYPKRTIGLATFRQTLEAPSLAASANIYLTSTSRARSLLELRAEEPFLSRFLEKVRRSVLLGYEASAATERSDPRGHVFSESARSVVSSVTGADRARIEEGNEELEGIVSSTSLDEETKLPAFIALSFFLPIMLMLFDAVARQTSPPAIVALLVVELVVLDLALSLSGSAAIWRGAGRG
jgi:hypothetical protein